MPLSYLTAAGPRPRGLEDYPFPQVAAATINGLVIAASLLFIVFGAILLLNTIQQSGALQVIPERLHRNYAGTVGSRSLSSPGCSDPSSRARRDSGTPAAVCVPLLVGLGFPAMAAVVAGMITQSTPVSFGAVGTPILVGVNRGLSDDAGVTAFVQSAGSGVDRISRPGRIQGGPTASRHGGHLYSPLRGLRDDEILREKPIAIREGIAVWKFALFAASCDDQSPTSSWPGSSGPEFPSLIGGPVGLMIVIFAAKRGFLMPARDEHMGLRKGGHLARRVDRTIPIPGRLREKHSPPR